MPNQARPLKSNSSGGKHGRMRAYVFLSLLLAVGLMGWLWHGSVARAPDANSRFVQVRIDGYEFKLEVADNTEARVKGLGGRTGLEDGEGMLFVFPVPGRKCFWMKDVSFPIDILWFSTEKRLVHAEHGVAPETYPGTFCSPADSKYVVELPAGTSAEIGLENGDFLEVENL